MKPIRFGLLVTGKGEHRFLPDFFGELCDPGPEGQRVVFHVIRKIEQLSPVTSEKRLARMVGNRKQQLQTRDEQIGLVALGFLRKDASSFVLLIDDLEHDRRGTIAEVRKRYKTALDTVLAGWADRAAVHFFVPMIEAYYFADASSINAVLDLELEDHDGDVEKMRHPKNDLKKRYKGFDEIEHGKQIVKRLRLEHVLAHPDRCAHLRSLVKWCIHNLGRELGDRFQLRAGRTA